MNNFDYTIKKSSRARYLRIKIDNSGEVIVTIPSRINERHGHDFVSKNSSWVLAKLKEVNYNKTEYKFESGEFLPYLGEEIKLLFKKDDRKYPKGGIHSDTMLIMANEEDINDKKKIREAIIKTYKKYFRTIIEEAVEEYTKVYGFKYNRIAIKDNKTNWGSCSSKKNLNFNWKLIFAPLDVIDYVVVHEVCHLKEQNHSSRFWDLVEKEYPDYKEKKKWLKDNGGKLMI